MDRITSFEVRAERIADRYGLEKQSVVLMEECAELIQAVSKMIRGEAERQQTIDHITEEIADVEICIAQCKHLLEIPDADIHRWMRYKLTRAENHIANEEDDCYDE